MAKDNSEDVLLLGFEWRLLLPTKSIRDTLEWEDAVHFQEGIFTENEILDLTKVKPLLYLGSEFYVTADKNSLSFIKRGI
jgi:hypothetical protein